MATKILVTTDKRSADDLESKGWTKLVDCSEYKLFPPNQTIPTKYQCLLGLDKKVTTSQVESKADVIRALFKSGKLKKEIIELMLKKFPECTKVSISSQVYTIANKL